MATQRETLSKADAVTVATTETCVPTLVVARDLVERFRRMLRSHDTPALLPWLNEAD